MKKICIASILFVCAAFSVNAFAKDAKCKVVLDGQTEFYGACTFKPIGKDGSFVLTNQNPRKLMLPNVREFWINIEQKNVADLASVDASNRFQKWDVTLIRSTRDRACWENEISDVSICAY